VRRSVAPPHRPLASGYARGSGSNLAFVPNSLALLAVRVRLHTLRNVIILVGTAAGFAVSFTVLQRAIGGSSPWLGLLGMFYLLGLAKVAEPFFLLRMPTTLRAVQPGRVLGVAGTVSSVPASPHCALSRSRAGYLCLGI